MSLQSLLRGHLSPKNLEPQKAQGLVLDAANTSGPSAADDYTQKDIALKAVSAIHEWVETDNLGAGETMADRLFMLTVGIADANKDGEISEDEQAVIDIALDSIWDYLAKCGANEDDIGALLNDGDDAAAERVRELVAASLPDGDDAAIDDMHEFVFGDDAQGAVFDATYKSVIAVKDGKKVRTRKRVSGSVHLTADQRVAIKKMQLHSHSAGAMMKRAKSMRLRQKMGI